MVLLQFTFGGACPFKFVKCAAGVEDDLCPRCGHSQSCRLAVVARSAILRHPPSPVPERIVRRQQPRRESAIRDHLVVAGSLVILSGCSDAGQKWSTGFSRTRIRQVMVRGSLGDRGAKRERASDRLGESQWVRKRIDVSNGQQRTGCGENDKQSPSVSHKQKLTAHA